MHSALLLGVVKGVNDLADERYRLFQGYDALRDAVSQSRPSTSSRASYRWPATFTHTPLAQLAGPGVVSLPDSAGPKLSGCVTSF